MRLFFEFSRIKYEPLDMEDLVDAQETGQE